ncbi:MAG: DUF2804 domain-containing protein [Propionibacteriaceae bacterium]
MNAEVEITEPVDLCLPSGRLNPQAVGWTRRPLHRANLRGWGRTKRWEYWGIVSPSHIITLMVTHLDFVGVHGVYILDRRTGVETTVDRTVPLGRRTSLPDRSGAGRVSVAAKDLQIEVDQEPEQSLLLAVGNDFRLELDLPVEPGRESLGVVVGWSPRLFQYTLKDVGRSVVGTLRLGLEEHPIPYESSFAVLDHGRGRWPHRVAWTWAAGSAADGGRSRAIQFGDEWTDGTGITENALVVDGRINKIPDKLVWEYDGENLQRPWEIRGARVHATFRPLHERVSRHNLGVFASEIRQVFGAYEGWAVSDSGEQVSLDGLVGWIERARHRW